MEKKIRTLGILHARSFSACLDEVRKKSGTTTRRLVIQHPSAVVVIPLLQSDQTLVVTQYRYVLGRETLELPAGKIGPGEDPQAAAHRELAEETGYEAEQMESLTRFAPSLGYSNEMIHVYVGRELRASAGPPDGDEIVKVEKMTLARLKNLILQGEVVDGTTIVALAAYEWLTGPLAEDR